MNDTERFALIQLDVESLDPMALAKALASIRGTPVQDQVIAAKRAWGIVEDDLSREEAQSLGHALREAGVACAVGHTAALASLPEAELAKTVDDLPDGPPVLVAAAAITVTTTRTTKERQGPSPGQKAASAAIMMSTGIPIKIGGRKRAVEKTHEEQTLSFFADLYYDGPARRLRIDAAHFDFSCLAERMVYHGQANLKLLLEDTVQAAPEARLNHGARIILEGKPIRTMGYGPLEDLEREARWLLTLRAAGR